MAIVKKAIKAVTETGPNYIVHIQALASINFKSDYARRYAHTISPQDLACLKEYGKLLEFGNGSGAILAGVFFFLPAYLNLDTQQKIDLYFSALEHAACGETAEFAAKYPFPENWVYPGDMAGYLKTLAPQRDAICSLSSIYRRNFEAYMAGAWPKEEPVIAEAAARVNGYFSARDTIAQWENLTGETFLYPAYRIVLSSALENGPNADSLGYERNLFYSGTELNYLVHLISHEVGTHLLMTNASMPIEKSGDFSSGDVYAAQECLSKFYNSMIIKENPVYDMSKFHDKQYLPVFKRIYSRNPAIKPAELLRLGLRKFLKNKGGITCWI